MKKIIKRIFLILLALVTAYTAVATALVHGLSVYRLDSALGGILAISRQVTLPVAVLLWIIVLILAWRWLAMRRKARQTADATSATGRKAGKKAGNSIPPKSATMPMPGAGTIPPKAAAGVTMPMPRPADPVPPKETPHPVAPATGATMPMPEAGTIPPKAAAGATMPMPRPADPVPPKETPHPAAPATGATMPMPWAGTIPPKAATGATMPMPRPADPVPPKETPHPAAPATGATMPMPEAGTIPPSAQTPLSGRICPNCGGMVRAGAKFCTKCGYRLEVEG